MHGNLHHVSLLYTSPRHSSVFRHLKGNIFVDDGGQPCIADIGVDTLAVREIYKGFSRVSGAWSYKAPEELLSGIRDQRTDVYSFACIVYAVSGSLDLPCN